jgi:hypothetical protein
LHRYDIHTAAYFVYVSLSTVGFGDLCPTTDTSKIFTAIFLLLGCGCFANLISAIASYKLAQFDFNLMQQLLGFRHNGAMVALLDANGDGEVTNGEFLLAYLVSLGKVRAKTAIEITSKFRELSLGKRYISLEAFCARSVAIKAGVLAGYQCDSHSQHAGLSAAERAEKAGEAAAKGAAECGWTYADSTLTVAEKACAEDVVKKEYAELRQEHSVEELAEMEKTIWKLLTKVRQAKNHEVKVSMAAGQAAGIIAHDAGMGSNQVVSVTKKAAIKAGGSAFEANIAAAAVIREVYKANGKLYRLQSEATEKIMAGEPLEEDATPAPAHANGDLATSDAQGSLL